MYELAYYLSAALLIGMPLALELGRRVRRSRLRKDPDTDGAGVGVLDGAIYALFGLLLAFIFSGAVTRFDHRRDLIIEEANAVGTAYLRVDLLPLDTQTQLRPLFRQYVEVLIATYRAGASQGIAMTEYQRDLAIQDQIWKLAVEGTRRAGDPAVTSLVLSSFNEMIDLTTTRWTTKRIHPPLVIYDMLLIVALAASFLAGMGMGGSRRRPWPHIIAFTLVISTTVFVILDIEFPRQGFIRLDAADQILIDLLHSMT